MKASTTLKQKEILLFLYQFRFLHTYQIQQLLNHKDPHRIKIWLKDLTDKKYLIRDYSTKSLASKATPARYCLAKKSIAVLNENDNCDSAILKRIYSERKRTKRFADRCLMIVDWYLFFKNHLKPDETIRFFTESMLSHFEYFPNPLPSAYIAITSAKGTRRYFFELFDDYTPSSIMRHRVRSYLRYAESGEWEANVEGKALPTILLACPTQRAKLHIKHYAGALFQKDDEESIQLYLTTNETIKNNTKDVWEKVSLL